MLFERELAAISRRLKFCIGYTLVTRQLCVSPFCETNALCDNVITTYNRLVMTIIIYFHRSTVKDVR